MSTTVIAALPVCVIGAGSSGITLAKSLLEQGVAFECLELGSKLGGMWRYENDNGLSSAYRSLHIDTSRHNLGYSDFPISSKYPDFLSHYQVLEHLEAYAERFGVVPHIRFNTRVEKVERSPDGSWQVHTAGRPSKRYRAVLVANGHLWDPRWPAFEGKFAGDQIHSHYYRTAEPYRDKRVLVVGIGNSAVDIAVDICKSASATFISSRRSAWIMPKYIMGIPTDRWSAFIGRKLKLPTRWTRSIMKRLMYLAVGDQARFGVPHPEHPIWREHATLSQELLPYAGHGWIKFRPNVKKLHGAQVTFEDGSTEDIDAIIYATGYKTTFPFLDRQLFAVADGESKLYRRMHPPGLPGLFFAGLVQPIGPTIPLAEIQGKWLASVMAGKIRLPDGSTMQQEVALHRAHQERQYVGSARYTLEVDFKAYAAQLRGDMTSGQAGAK